MGDTHQRRHGQAVRIEDQEKRGLASCDLAAPGGDRASCSRSLGTSEGPKAAPNTSIAGRALADLAILGDSAVKLEIKDISTQKGLASPNLEASNPRRSRTESFG